MVFAPGRIDPNRILTRYSETSAHTLCFALVLLALHPDIQERVYEEARRLWPDGLPPANSSVCDFPFVERQYLSSMNDPSSPIKSARHNW